jgi:hypothetical protein
MGKYAEIIINGGFPATFDFSWGCTHLDLFNGAFQRNLGDDLRLIRQVWWMHCWKPKRSNLIQRGWAVKG